MCSRERAKAVPWSLEKYRVPKGGATGEDEERISTDKEYEGESRIVNPCAEQLD